MKSTPTIKQIEDYSCTAYGVTMTDINDKTFYPNTSKARKMIYYLIFQHTKLQSGEIAKMYDVKKKQTIDDNIKELRFHRHRGGALSGVITGFEKGYIN
jgi:chromosomal replication initiation ATPase DnaA